MLGFYTLFRKKLGVFVKFDKNFFDLLFDFDKKISENTTDKNSKDLVLLHSSRKRKPFDGT